MVPTIVLKSDRRMNLWNLRVMVQSRLNRITN